MDESLDVLVTTPPLNHVTKSRIRNNSRKISTPSRSHLKRVSVNDVDFNISEENIVFNLRSKNMSAESGAKKLKLPPPPVAKKPKLKVNPSGMNVSNSGSKQTETTFVGRPSTGNVESRNVPNVSSKKEPLKSKPVVLPKPDMSNRNPTDEVVSKLQGLELAGKIKDQVMAEDRVSKPLSFSERLKASSLSRKTEQNVSGGSPTKLRSQIIAPARRGSRIFMNADSTQEKAPSLIPALSLFKKRSSETPNGETAFNPNTQQNIFHDKVDNSVDDLEPENASVQPLSVSTVLSANSFDEDEEDVSSKDSFDTKELNFALDQEESFELNNKDFLRTSNLTDKQPIASLLNKGPDSTDSYKSYSSPSLRDINNLQESTQDNFKNKPNKPQDVFSHPRPSLELNLNRGKLQNDDSLKSPAHDSPKPYQPQSSIFFNAKRIKSPTKEAPRRKFKPVGASEYTPSNLSKNTSDQKNETSCIDDKFDKIDGQNHSSFEVDSSLEMVTQDIDLDSSDNFLRSEEDGPSFSIDVSQDSVNKMEVDGIATNDDVRLMEDFNSRKDFAARQIPDEVSTAVNADMNETASAYTDGDTLDLDDIISDVTLGMLPSQPPPPPVAIDSSDSDADDVTLNIIDPPYFDDDDDDDDDGISHNEKFNLKDFDIPDEDSVVKSDGLTVENIVDHNSRKSDFSEGSSTSKITSSHHDETKDVISHIPSEPISATSNKPKATNHITNGHSFQNINTECETSIKDTALPHNVESLSMGSKPAQAIQASPSNDSKDKSTNDVNVENIHLVQENEPFQFEVPEFQTELDFDVQDDETDDYNFQIPIAPPMLPDAPFFDDNTDSEDNGSFGNDDIIDPLPPPPLEMEAPLFDEESDSANEDANDNHGRISPSQLPPPDIPPYDIGDIDCIEGRISPPQLPSLGTQPDDFTNFDDVKTIPPPPLSYTDAPHYDSQSDVEDSEFQIKDYSNFQTDSQTDEARPDSFSNRFLTESELQVNTNINGTRSGPISHSSENKDSRLDGLSEKGKQRKKSFQSVNEKALVEPTSRDKEANKNEISNFQKVRSNFENRDDEKMKTFGERKSNASKLAGDDTVSNRTQNVISAREDTIDDDTANGSTKEDARPASWDLALNKSDDVTPNRRLSSSSIDLQVPSPDRSSLSPASSSEFVPESDRLITRRLSSSSLNHSDGSPNLVRGRRGVCNRTWSSFDSSSGDEEADHKKVNIVKLMRERTLTQDEGIADGVQMGPANEAERIRSSFGDVSDTESNQEYSQDFSGQNFESSPLDEWTVEDVGDWLEMIGFGELRAKFEEKQVGGLELMAIDFQLLDEMGITNAEDRELILSEIYALKNPEDIDIELSLLDALDNASGYDREKMLALLEALKMPSEDNDNNYLPPSPSPKLSPRHKHKNVKSKSLKDKYKRAVSECLPSQDTDDSFEERSKSASPARNYVDPLSMSMDSGLLKKAARNDKKKSKKQSFLNAFSFRRKGSGKIARLFSSRKKLVDSSLKYLLQASPQGVVKILAHRNDAEAAFIPLLVTLSTTAAEIVKSVLEKLEMNEDANVYYLVQAHTSKSVPEVKLGDEECPLVLQCRWPDAERYRFEMKKKPDGSVIVVYSMEGSSEERSVKIETSLNTTCEAIITIALKKLQRKEPSSSFSLLPMKNDKHRKTIEDSQIPLDAVLLKLTKNLTKPAVYRLVRINFLGSPERVPVEDDAQSGMIESLKESLHALANNLESANRVIATKEKEIAELTDRKFENEKLSKDKEKQIHNLENLVESMKSHASHQSELQSSIEDTFDSSTREEFLETLAEKEEKIKMLNEKIEDLENVLHTKDEQVRKAEEIHRENESLKDVAEKLQKNLDMQDAEINSLRKVQHENEMLNGKLKTLEKILLKKEEQLQDVKRVSEKNEELQSQISSLERVVKQKERAAKEALDSQSELMDLRRTVKVLQDELAEKDETLNNSQHEFIELREKLNEDIESKIQTIESLMTDVKQLKLQASGNDQEKKELRLKLKESELRCEERRRQLEEISGVNEEYKVKKDGQHQRIKKLERELTLRSDELQQVSKEKDLSTEDLRNHIETLEQSLLEKGSTILDLEFKLQKVERRLKDSEDAADEELRQKNHLNLTLDDLSQKSKELSKKLENYKKLVVEKDKQIQSLKGSQNRNDEKLKVDLNAAQRSLVDKDNLISLMKQKMDDEKMELKSHLVALQELTSSKDAKWKEKELRIVKEKEDAKQRTTQLEARINEKEATIRKFEAKVGKLEVMGRENMRKFEKFMSDKDRMLKQVKEDAEKDLKALKEKLRMTEEAQNEKEKHIRRLNRGNSFEKDAISMKLKQKEEENKQNKYLLERLMAVVNDKNPDLLEQFESSFGESPKKPIDKQPLLPKVDEDWC